MKTLHMDNGVLHLSHGMTQQCPFLQSDGVYASEQRLPEWILAVTDMMLVEFYQQEIPQPGAAAYTLSPAHQEIVKRFPHTNTRLQLDEQSQYRFSDIPVCIATADLLQAVKNEGEHSAFFQRLAGFSSLLALTETELVSDAAYKRKRLHLNGEYGVRECLHPSHQQNAKCVDGQLVISRELYYFAHYIYAAVIEFEPQYGIDSYDKFHQAFGKFIYSVTLTKGDSTLPLLWPDYLYHQPENHLEFGIPLIEDDPRYLLMQSWQEGDEITIRILAEGFQDLVLSSRLKRPHCPPPQLLSKQYQADRPLSFSPDLALLQEIRQAPDIATVITPDKCKIKLSAVDFTLTDTALVLPLTQFSQQGLFQLAIRSHLFGEMLFFFHYEKEENAKKQPV
ncbi:MAG: hypothetical protein XXXJIFNMEKO3_02114 [Candidatus Erwinia impunctatus]|nr:hypothetical protein XXXJIFNMEKO_02114 [Culicoides impunctatus]